MGGLPCWKIDVGHTDLFPVSTYFSYPEDKQTANAILILPDVIGHEFINAQLYATFHR